MEAAVLQCRSSLLAVQQNALLAFNEPFSQWQASHAPIGDGFVAAVFIELECELSTRTWMDG